MEVEETLSTVTGDHSTRHQAGGDHSTVVQSTGAQPTSESDSDAIWRPEFDESGDWFKAPLPRETLVRLSERSDRAGLLHFGSYFTLLAALGIASVLLWGSWWFAAAYLTYCLVWSFANAAVHEACHYTPFRRLKLNDALLYACSWMLNMEPVTVRWVHARHHTHTSMVGDDAEYLLPNPISRRDLANLLIGTNHFWNYNKELVLSALRRPAPMIAKSVPADDLPLTVRNSRVFLGSYAAVIVWSVAAWSPLPFVMLVLPRVVGEPMHGILRMLQHGGLETGVADHRRTTRSMYVSRPMRWIYCNMNFHIEHHMFPMVPFHSLPGLHEEIKAQLPAATNGIAAGITEVVRTMRRQRREPDYRLRDRVPPGAEWLAAATACAPTLTAVAMAREPGVIDVGAKAEIPVGDVMAVEHDGVQYALCRVADERFYAVADVCTHQSARLSEGVLIGCEIECPLHQGRFDVVTGEATRRPARRPVAAYSVRLREGRVLLDTMPAREIRAADARMPVSRVPT